MSKMTEQVYLNLRRRIMSGDLPPGGQVKEEHVAAELSVSRTPVRTAIQRLIGDGLLINEKRRGAFVAEWTRKDIEEVFDLRILLESHAARRAAHRATSKQIAEMHTLTDRMEQLAHDKPLNFLGEIQTANNRFHRLLLQASGSPRLRVMAESLVDIPVIIGAFYLYKDEDTLRSIQHHRDLLLALEAHDPVLAEEVMQIHLRIAFRVFMRSRDTTEVVSTNTDREDN